MGEGLQYWEKRTSANFILARSLSLVPVRACSRFFVSANFSPCNRAQESEENLQGTREGEERTGRRTNPKGMPCTRVGSLLK